MNNTVGIIYVPAANGLPGLEERHVARLRRDFPGIDWRMCGTKDEVLPLLPEARVMVTWAFSSKWSELAPNLRLLSTPAAGRELIRAEARPGLTIRFGTYHGDLMAETVLGMMLAFCRGVRDCVARGGEGWPRGEVAAGMRTLRRSHVVVLGFGNIGKWVGRLAKPFGMRVTGVNRSDMTRPEYFDEGDRVVAVDRLDEVLPEADHLVMVLPGDESTSGIMDARRLALLRPDAYLYNMGRGNSVDLAALAAALRSGALAGAGLDVYPEEPLSGESPIRGCPNVILMPHVSAFAPNYFDLYLDELSPALEAVCAGGGMEG